MRFIKEIGSNGDFGIWHEAYTVKPGNYECVYNNMPPFGLAKVAQAVAIEGTLDAAAGRLAAGAKSP